MSSFFNALQQPAGINSAGYLGNQQTQGTYPVSGLNNPPGFNGLQPNNLQQQQVVDSRSTVRQLTTLIPEWKGHFDLADVMLTSQEQILTNVGLMISQLKSVFDQLQTSHDSSKGSLSDINLHHDKLDNELKDRVKYQDAQNLVTIKSRRLCEILISDAQTTDVSSVFRIPNHINVQVSKELYDKVKNLKNEVDFIQNEVQMLKEIDVFQAPNFIESVLVSQDARINTMGDALSRLLDRAESVLKRDFRKDVWTMLSEETTTLRKTFLEAIGLEPTKKTELIPVTELKQQIKYLKKFNTSYNDPNFPYLRDYGYNIKDLLTNTIPNQNVFVPGPTLGSGVLYGAAGPQTTLAQQYQTQPPLGTTQYGSTLTGMGGTTYGTTGLTSQYPSSSYSSFGTSTLYPQTGAMSNLPGQSYGQPLQAYGTGQLGAGTTGYGSTYSLPGLQTTQPTNLFSSTQSLPATGLYGSTPASTGVFSSTMGNTGTMPGTTTGGYFGSTTTMPGTTTTTGLYGSTAPPSGSLTGTGTGIFGASSTMGGQGTTTTGMFGGSGYNVGSTGYSATATQPSTTGIFGSTATTTGTGTGTSVFGGTTTMPGTTTGTGIFGSGTTTGSTFGAGTTTGSTFATGTGSTFGQTTTGSAFGANTGSTFGSTNTGSTFGATGTGTTGIFGSSNTGTGLYGSTTGTATGSGTSFGYSSNVFGSGSTSSGALFGSSQTKPPGTDLVLYNNPSTTGFSSFNRN